jgi:hypothetical protein
MSDAKRGLQEVVAAAKAYQKLLKKYGTEEEMGKVFKELFAKHPDVKGVAWSQFAPYFNDGSACIFSVHEPYATLEEVTQDVLDNTSGGYGVSCEYDEETKEGARWFGDDGDYEVSEEEQAKLEAFIKDFNDIMIEDLFQRAFGEDTFIIVTPNGITIGEAEHD